MLSDASKPAFNINAPGARKKLADDILEAINDYCQKAYYDGHRRHLGASLIGRECHRYLWSTFRWLKAVPPRGQLARLFNRGHREEERFVEWLRGIGFQVWEVAEDGSQHRVKACGGHFGGSLDGICRPAPAFDFGEPLLLEFKTSGTGSSFTALSKSGVKVAKPEHYTQMCIYGRAYGFRNALYLCINKNDDSLYPEIVELDWKEGEQSELKAEKIITSPYAPAKVSESPAFVTCLRCDFAGICHAKEQPEKNCRSCKFASPAQDSAWSCSHFGGNIPPDFIPKGCDNWQSVV